MSKLDINEILDIASECAGKAILIVTVTTAIMETTYWVSNYIVDLAIKWWFGY